MNSKVAIALAGIGGALIGSAVTFFATKAHFKKKVDDICDECTEDVERLDKQLKALKKAFIEDQPPEVSGINAEKWKQISDDISNQKAQLYKEPAKKEETPTEDSDIMARPKKTPHDYSKQYQTSAPKELPPMTRSRPAIEPARVEHDIFFISEDDYEENEWCYDTKYLNFYSDSGLIFDDTTDELIEDYDIEKYIGVPYESIREMFVEHRANNPDLVHEFFVCNEQHGYLYHIDECAGEGPRP